MTFVDLVNRPGLRICRSGSLLVIVFGPGPTKLTDLELIHEHEETAVSERGRISIITVTPNAQSERLPEDVRLKSAALERWLDDVAVASATVISGGGLGVTLLRSARSALGLVGRGAAPRRLFGDLAEALAWVKARPDQVPEVQRITVDQLTAHLGLTRARAA